MFNWKAILVLAMGYTGLTPVSIPVGYLPAESPPITVQSIKGDPGEDYAQAARTLGEGYNETLGCLITLNQNSMPFRRKYSTSVGPVTAPLVKYLNDGTDANISPRLFLIAHELGHCYDNFTRPIDALNSDGYQAWKEGYADTFAVLVLKQQGTPLAQLETLAYFRESRMPGKYGAKWGTMLREAMAASIEGSSDGDFLKMANLIRDNIWKADNFRG